VHRLADEQRPRAQIAQTAAIGVIQGKVDIFRELIAA
jgi:hypothetical protein